ncbi:hypothetical protein MHBO_002626 [Bonamia ostreae]|uniref:Uncharacterized protein n=1 Tax=Bonamia ostreae TaxID=126728 RepID=A0ABV2AMY1_9EUKA
MISAIDFDSIKNAALKNLSSATSQVEKLLELEIILLLRSKIVEFADYLFANSSPTTKTVFIGSIYLLIGIGFMFFPTKFFKMVLGSSSFLFGTALFLYFISNFFDNLETNTFMILSILVVAVLSGFLFAKIIAKAFKPIFLFAITVSVIIASLILANYVSEYVVENFNLGKERVLVGYLKIISNDRTANPILGIIAFHVFVATVIFALSSIHKYLSIALIISYFVSLNDFVPSNFGQKTIFAPVIETVQKSVGREAVPFGHFLCGGLTILFAFEILMLLKITRFNFVSKVLGILAGFVILVAGIERITSGSTFSVPEEYMIRIGSRHTVSLISLATAATCSVVAFIVRNK